MWSYNKMSHDQLMHYGILGMRWGVRRSESQLRRARGSKKTRTDQDVGNDSNKKVSSKPKSFRDMDDDELNKAVNRLKKEKEYIETYNYLNPEKVSAGKKFATNFKNNMISKSAETTSSLVNDWLKKKGLKALGLDNPKSEEDKMMDDLMKKHNFLKTVSAMYTYADNIKKKSGESESSSNKKEPEWANWTMDDVDKATSTAYGQSVVERLLIEKDKDK